MAEIGDRYIFHSEDGGDYDIKIVDINNLRPP